MTLTQTQPHCDQAIRRSGKSRPLSSDWVASGVACRQLGISHKHLWKLRDEGLLKEGQHWRNIARSHAARPTYRWHLKRVEQALEVPQEMR